MRETLHFKDDDSRLSFCRATITMTNLSDEDGQNYKDEAADEYFVHTTNPELRVKLTKIRNAAVPDYLYKMAAAGTEINTQIKLLSRT